MATRRSAAIRDPVTAANMASTGWKNISRPRRSSAIDRGRRGVARQEDALTGETTRHRIYSVSVASVYPHYVTKAEKKGRTKAEVDAILCWLTGHSQETLAAELADKTNFEDFFTQAPAMNPARFLIT